MMKGHRVLPSSLLVTAMLYVIGGGCTIVRSWRGPREEDSESRDAAKTQILMKLQEIEQQIARSPAEKLETAELRGQREELQRRLQDLMTAEMTARSTYSRVLDYVMGTVMLASGLALLAVACRLRILPFPEISATGQSDPRKEDEAPTE